MRDPHAVHMPLAVRINRFAHFGVATVGHKKEVAALDPAVDLIAAEVQRDKPERHLIDERDDEDSNANMTLRFCADGKPRYPYPGPSKYDDFNPSTGRGFALHVRAI